ncbi:MAG: DUF4364 family protein [Oscillospiraceae bacterium]|nr:DUF4364 family protein [Oscillospiraceae bacterium]
MDNYDAFSAGIEAGGLRRRDDIKVLICYLVKSLSRPLNREQLSEIMQVKSIANYFEVAQALTELVASGNIVLLLEDGHELLYLTDDGRMAAETLENDLPKSVREKAIDAGVELLTRARYERESDIEIEKLGNGYNVHFSIFDKDDTLMKLTVYAADFSQANVLKENFLRDPVKLYAGIIAMLTT